MADTKRTIEILLQIKQLGKELVDQTAKSLQNIGPATAAGATQAGAAIAGVKAPLTELRGAVTTATAGVKRDFKEAADAGSTSMRGMLKDLKGRFGEESALGMGIKTLMGGGVLMGVGLAARELANFTGKISEMATAIRSGEATFQESIAGMLRQVPLLGPMVQTFDNLREAITGEAAALQQEAEYVKASEAAWRERQKIIEAGAAAVRTLADEYVRLRNEWRLLTAGPDAKAGIQTQIEAETAVENLWRTYQKSAQLTAPDSDRPGPLIAARKDFKDAQEVIARTMDALASAQARYDQLANARAQSIRRNEFGRTAAIAEAMGTQAQLINDIQAKLEAFRTGTFQPIQSRLQQMEAVNADLLTQFYKDQKQVLDNYGLKTNQLEQKADDEARKSQEATRKRAVLRGEEFKKLVEDTFVKPLQKSLDDAAKAGEQWRQRMVSEADKVRASIATPEQKRDTELANADALHRAGFLTAADLAAEQKRILAEYAAHRAKLDQEARAHADRRVLAEDEFQVRIADGQQKAFAQAQLEYDQDVQNFRRALEEKLIDQTRFEELVSQAARELADKERAAKLAALAQNETPAVPTAPSTRGVAGLGTGAAAGLAQFREEALNTAAMGERVVLGSLNGIAGALTDIMMGATSAAEAFRRFAASLLADLTQMILKAMLWNALTMAFPGLAGVGAVVPVAGGVAGKNKGGWVEAVRRFAGGGWVPGSGPDRDSVPAWLTPGEFVVNRRAAQMPGMAGMLESINAGMNVLRRSAGGVVPPVAPALAGGTGGGGGTTVVPVMLAGEAQMRTWLAGGGNALLDYMQANAGKFSAALGRGGAR